MQTADCSPDWFRRSPAGCGRKGTGIGIESRARPLLGHLHLPENGPACAEYSDLGGCESGGLAAGRSCAATRSRIGLPLHHRGAEGNGAHAQGQLECVGENTRNPCKRCRSICLMFFIDIRHRLAPWVRLSTWWFKTEINIFWKSGADST